MFWKKKKKKKKELSEKEIELKKRSRRQFLKAGLYLGVGGYLLGDCIHTATTPWYTHYDPPEGFDAKALEQDLPLLREMMFEEVERYTTLPNRAEFNESLSLEDIAASIYPQVVEATHTFLDLEPLDVATIKGSVVDLKIRDFDWAFLAGLFSTAIGTHLLKPHLQESPQLAYINNKTRDFSIAGIIIYPLLTVLRTFETAGAYDTQTHEIFLHTLFNSNDTTSILTHEYVHAITQNRFPELYDQPKWVTEGLAEALSTAVIEDSGIIAPHKDSFYTRKVASLIATYYGVCDEFDIIPDIPQDFKWVESTIGPSPYIYGSAFFQLQARKHGQGIYKTILEEQSLDCVAPLPLPK